MWLLVISGVLAAMETERSLTQSRPSIQLNKRAKLNKVFKSKMVNSVFIPEITSANSPLSDLPGLLINACQNNGGENAVILHIYVRTLRRPTKHCICIYVTSVIINPTFSGWWDKASQFYCKEPGGLTMKLAALYQHTGCQHHQESASQISCNMKKQDKKTLQTASGSVFRAPWIIIFCERTLQRICHLHHLTCEGEELSSLLLIMLYTHKILPHSEIISLVIWKKSPLMVHFSLTEQSDISWY